MSQKKKNTPAPQKRTVVDNSASAQEVSIPNDFTYIVS